MLTEDLKILAEECGFFFYKDEINGQALEADDWEAIHRFANVIVNKLILKVVDSGGIDHDLLNFLNFKLGEEFRKYGIHVNKRNDSNASKS